MSLRKRALSGLIWAFAQQFGTQFFAFFISIILARILMPEDFGLIGMVTVFIAIAMALTDAGLTQSLIRDKETDQEDLSTVFYFNLGASIIIYFILFFVAPLIANFYEEPSLTEIIRILSLTFIITAFGTIQKTRLTKMMNFKAQTLISLPSTFVSGIIGIGMAYYGYGVWSLVWNRITDAFLKSIQFWIYSKWTPDLAFNFQKFKKHFNFGYKIAVSGFIYTFFNNIYIIVIGKFFEAGVVGFYTKSESLRNLPLNNVSSALNRVTYPLFAEIQDDNERLKRVYSQIMQMVVFLTGPLLVFGAILAEPTFHLLLTEKWMPAVPYFQILCIAGLLYPVNSYNLNILKVKGKSDVYLKLEVSTKFFLILSLVIGVYFGIFGLLISQVVNSIFNFIFYSHFSGKYIDYRTGEQFRDIIPIYLLIFLSGISVYLMDKYLLESFSDYLRIIIGLLNGLLVYAILMFLFKKDIINVFRNIINK